MKTFFTVLGAFCLIFIPATQALAQLSEVILNPQDATADDQFGYAVAIHKDWAVVGSWLDDDKGAESGSAYVYHKTDSSWQFHSKLTASDGEPVELFGSSVAIHDAQILIGADRDSIDQVGNGSAYLFEYNGTNWEETHKFMASDRQEQDRFGTSVAVSPGHVLIGAPNEDSLGDNAGAAYFYVKNSSDEWIEQKILPNDGERDDRFGQKVAMDGLLAVISSHGDDDGQNGSGSAYVFGFDGGSWIFDEKIQAVIPTSGAKFGSDVDIDNNRIVVGEQLKGINNGAAYVFEAMGGNWTQIANLSAGDGQDGDEYGVSVAIYGDTVLVGSINDEMGNLAGAAYMYIRDTITGNWAETKILASDPLVDARFGNDVGIDRGELILGAYRHDGNGEKSGKAYILSKDNNTTVLPLLDIVDFSLSPNPVVEDLNLSFSWDKRTTMQIRLVDLQGKEVLGKNWEVQAGYNEMTLKLHDVSPGIYLLQLLSDRGVMGRKIMIDR